MPPISVPRVWIRRRKNMHMNQMVVDTEDEGCAERGGGQSEGVDEIR
jgi:hypothetical protein